jgi:DNA-binding GntR family transcriptional regulator
MRSAFAELRPLSNRPDAVDLVAHRRFHRAIYAASHNELLIATLESLWDRADRYRVLGLQEVRDETERDETAAEHQAILNAVVAGDAAGAAEVMRRHIRSSLGAKALSRLTVTPPHEY